MKTTVPIPDTLFEEARKVAQRERIILKALVEEGLPRIIADRKWRNASRLRKASFKENGLQPDFQGVSWEPIRELSYEGRGG